MSIAIWDELHTDERHRLRYPSEHVVRFLAGLNLARPSHYPYFGNALDIGCGSGRHLRLLEDAGFCAHGVDASVEAVAFCRDLDPAGGVTRAPMTALPYPKELFDVVVAYGVFYYGTWVEMQRAVDEMHRVLKPGGRAFVCVRTTDDWRARRGEKVDTLTYRLELPREIEDGMTMTFMPESRIEAVYATFSEIEWEKSETTVNRNVDLGRARRNSDWLITVTK